MSAAVPSAWHERRIRAAGTTLAVYERGSCARGARVVLLLHGLGHWTDAAWTRLVDELDPSLRFVALDLPGFGASEKPDVTYGRAFFRRTVSETAAALGLERFAVAGHSLGGFIAADWAAAHPERVTHLALIAPAAFGRTPRHVLYGVLARTASRRLFALRPSKRFVETILRRAVVNRAVIDRNHLERAFELSQQLEMRRAFAGVYASAIETLAGRRALLKHLARYAGPVFCAWGRHDRYLPASALHDVAKVYPQATTLLLDHSGHLPMLEEPERLGDALNTFLFR